VLGVHKESDLALLKIVQTNLPTLSLEEPQNIRVGQMVLAVGSPEGLQNSSQREAVPGRVAFWIRMRSLCILCGILCVLCG
jgi:serine protease Do